MKDWLRFFLLSFFSDKTSKEAQKRSYANFFLALLLALGFLWIGFFGGNMFPFKAHYKNSPDFKSTVRAVFANPDTKMRIGLQVGTNTIKAKIGDGEYKAELLVNTYESQTDNKNYSVGGYGVVVDMRPADTLAAFEAYCVSNDGKNTVISYEEYLTLSDVAKLNFDFKLKYTGAALVLDDALISSFKAYIDTLSEDNRLIAQDLQKKLDENALTNDQYNRAIYELYFENYYPQITAYETNSKVPLLRNYYFQQYVSDGQNKYLLVFDDCMVVSFETKKGILVSFYGFYDGVQKGVLVSDTQSQAVANQMADTFIKKAFDTVASVNLYAYATSVIMLTPFIALMPMVVTLLAYSILKLCGVQSVKTMGAMFKIVGSYVWFSGIAATAIMLILAFFVQRNLISALTLVLFFVILTVRTIIFAINQVSEHKKQIKKEEAEKAVV